MLWSVLSLQTKMVAMFVCAIIIALSVLIIICFLIPDAWWILPWPSHQADEDQALNEDNDVRLRDYHQWRPEEEDPAETELSIHNGPMDSWKKLKKSSGGGGGGSGGSGGSRLSRNELCYDSSGYSVDSGRPGSLLTGDRESSLSNGSSVVSLSPSSSRSGSTTTLGVTTDEPGGDGNRPQVHLTLQTHVVGHQPTSDAGADVKNGPSALDVQLIVTIENATDLPSRSYVDTVDPSVSVRLERRTRLGSLMGALIGSSSGSGGGRGRRSSGQVLTEDSTCPVVYHSRHPRFHHPVTLSVPKSTHLKDCQLIVRVEDKDKLVGTTELGESRIDLRELDLLAGWLEGGQRSAAGESTVRLSRFIDIFKAEEKGAVLLGLSFLPTSQRITVHVTQCNRLAKTADTSSTPVKAVVRLFLLNESGRVLKKRKTAPFDHPNGAGGGRVELDELFHLDVEIERWDRCVILIVLSRIVSPPIAEQPTTTTAVRSPPVYQHSGHVALGKRVLGQAERIHWNSAFQSPRRVISQWHGLH